MTFDGMFYLTLPSNSSMNYYPDNTLAHFTTKLPQDVDLTGKWEVALVELQYPHSYYNIRTGEATMSVTVGRNADPVIKKLHAGFYPSAKILVRSVNALLNERKIKFGYNDVTNKVYLEVKSNCQLMMTTKLCDMLGLEPRVFGDSPGIYYAHKTVDVHQGFYAMYVYCDIAQSVVVGDMLAPLMRTVPLKGKSGEMQLRAFQNLQFKPLQRNHFNTVEIDIRNDSGEPVAFDRGKVVATLAFRRARSSYLS